MVDLVQQQLTQERVVLVEAAGQGIDEGGVLGTQPAQRRSASRSGSRSPAISADRGWAMPLANLRRQTLRASRP
jgi:hypothetical protein